MQNVTENSVFLFNIYENSRTNTKYLLFKGVGNIANNGKIEILHKYDFMTSDYGYKRLRNYYDMLEKFGPHKCIIITSDGTRFDNISYSSQDEIAEKFDIKLSKLQKRAFSEKDIVGSKRILKMSNLKQKGGKTFEK